MKSALKNNFNDILAQNIQSFYNTTDTITIITRMTGSTTQEVNMKCILSE